MNSDANGVYRGVYTYGEERISVRDLVEVEGVPNDPLYYMYDGRGSVTQLTNAVGNVRDKYRYTPFGEPMSGGKLSPNTKLLNNPYGYNGEYHDLESGFQYLRARYYNPETARFITRDSYLGQINEPLTLNRYAYTSNNPVMKIDPSGHINLEAGGGGGSSSSTYSTSTSSSSYTKTASSRPVVEWGSDNKEAVKTLQTMLKTLHYDIGKSGVDGIFGDDTDAAVRAFQRNNGLKVDGIVGINTWTKLEEIYNNVIGTGIIPDNVLLGSNGSGGNSGSFVNSKVVDAKGSSKNTKDCGGIDGISSAAKYSDDLSLQLERYSYIKDPAMRVYNAWNATSPEERLQILKIDSRAYAGEQFVSRLSYLQYRKGIDVTQLKLNELDRIYEEVHYTRVATTMDYLNISSVIAEGYEKVGKGISELLKKTKGVSNPSNVIYPTRVQKILDTMPELTGTNREKLLSAIQNKNLRKIANELYRPGATIGDGGTAAGLVDDYIKGNSKHLQKANERVIGLKKALNSNELGLNDLDIAEALLDDLEDAINLFK